jgi:hypothetical protein
VPSSVPVPRVVVPSLNVTVPVGMPPALVTVALKVTELPYADGLADDVGVFVVVAAWFTTCERAADWADAAKFVLPP